ncbi:UDP-2-acetamido-2,6-beta-L-arabino-hexul-4-ose reductase [Ollibium composti]|uniref:SDR family oxidoreductase n=1 Tax=Ollibium composti TaxID=2675109 RepID=A0ABY2Q5G7_9HYPH|nr:NAD-dependent epimerase/dehydratase family protein [Mesorhizobium composti]THF56602.1 SDR family oxidoreductase [Mesorhizobium composti]
MRIVVTGANGFIGRNLMVRFTELGYADVVPVTRATTSEGLAAALESADFVFHLAGTNRPKAVTEFATGNVGFTNELCDALRTLGRPVPVAYTSSTQATLQNPYGASKLAAEDALLAYGRETGAPIHIFRLTNVFGKWSRPNYNSAVATFCHNIARGLPIKVSDPAAPLKLVYVDDVIAALVDTLAAASVVSGFVEVAPVYETTVGKVADMVASFSASRKTMITPRVGCGLLRALHATYLTYLPVEDFAYSVPVHSDPRGEFVEMLKTGDSGQFSYFTAHPGITRGEHYHHTKTEKFLVIRGTAHFGFRNINTGEAFELMTRGGEACIVETVPGWAHNITNIGDDELIVMLWANEIFDRTRPDTIGMKVKP